MGDLFADLYALAQSKVPEPDKVIKRYKDLAAEAAKTREELRRKIKELDDERSEVRREAGEMVDAMMHADVKEFNELFKSLSELKEIGEMLPENVYKVFKAVFGLGPSKTAEICGKKKETVHKWSSDAFTQCAITYGKKGFGLRYNQQSRTVQRWDEVKAVLRRKDEVLDGLKDAKMFDVYRKFQRFSDAMPEELLGDAYSWELRFDLEHPVELENESSATKVGLQKSQAYRGESYVTLHSENNRTEVRFDGGRTDEIVYLQVRSELLRRREEFKKRVEETKTKFKGVMDTLQKEFARECLMMEL